MRRNIALALTFTVLSGIGVSGCEAADDEETKPAVSAPASAALTWGSCPAAAAGAPARDPRQTCGTLKVPLNYDDPGGETIEVAVSRISAVKKEQRRGVLLLNPGGPGLSGLDMATTMASALPASVLDRYDLIGFDPRGVGHSSPQSCGLTDPSLLSLFPFPAADGSITANEKSAAAVAKQCESAGKNLPYYTTANTARDLDRIRLALGEEKISYWGQTYGTYLGTVYGSLFPDRTDRVVLEGVVDATRVWQDQATSWGRGMAERFPDAAAVAAAQDAELGLGKTAEEVTAAYLALADRLDRKPAPVPGTPLSVSGPLLRNITYALLLHNENLPMLATFWKAVVDLDGNSLTDADKTVLQQVFADIPATPGVPADNEATMFLSLMCGDAPWSRDPGEYAARIAAERKTWPLTAGMPVNIWPCAFWPNPPREAPVTVSAQGPRNVLILQNRRDNATPWETGVGLRKVLGERAGFVGADNGGHYVYRTGSTCADEATVAFLTDGELPAKDLYCTDVK